MVVLLTKGVIRRSRSSACQNEEPSLCSHVFFWLRGTRNKRSSSWSCCTSRSSSTGMGPMAFFRPLLISALHYNTTINKCNRSNYSDWHTNTHTTVLITPRRIIRRIISTRRRFSNTVATIKPICCCVVITIITATIANKEWKIYMTVRISRNITVKSPNIVVPS